MATADILGYLPYLLGIGTALVWYWQGIARDAWYEFKYLMRRRGLRVFDGSSQRRHRSPLWRYLGEFGPSSRGGRSGAGVARLRSPVSPVGSSASFRPPVGGFHG